MYLIYMKTGDKENDEVRCCSITSSRMASMLLSIQFPSLWTPLEIWTPFFQKYTAHFLIWCFDDAGVYNLSAGFRSGDCETIQWPLVTCVETSDFFCSSDHLFVISCLSSICISILYVWLCHLFTRMIKDEQTGPMKPIKSPKSGRFYLQFILECISVCLFVCPCFSTKILHRSSVGIRTCRACTL